MTSFGNLVLFTEEGDTATWRTWLFLASSISNFAYSICVFTLSTYFTIARRASRLRSIPSLFAFSTIPLVFPRVNVRSLRCFDRKFLVDPNFAPSRDRIWLPIYDLLCSLTSQNACFITFFAFNKQILELNHLFSALYHQKTAIRLQYFFSLYCHVLKNWILGISFFKNTSKTL